MKRRHFISGTAFSLAALALSRSKAFAALAPNSYQFKPLRRNVGMFAEQGGTIAWLANNEGIVVVDAEFPAPAGDLICELKNLSDQPFRYLINTHHHGDHTSGNISFKGLVKHVVAHENSLKNQKAVAQDQKTEDKQLYPDITYTKNWKIKIGDEKIKTYYWGPGHTNGDSMIHFEEANIVHTGDLVFNRRYPFIDNKAGASVVNWAKVLEKAQKQFDKDTLFVFGHAYDPEKVTGTMEDIKAMQNYMEQLVVFVQKEIDAGKTRNDILSATAIPGIDEWKGDGIQRSLQAAYEELTL
ncbi:MBL fold metallo-hydrolase [Mucilaginibacter sp. KACC 22063]|uniref:MBL fold metallo-hydrolase n=1 Tax=Mucilaginibacter sp. KACC 22063 TaxID=3025666 RepID=UPI002366C73A|nr:MBL fold metallo-hydrolase [Mucilaginibacter sp. KACC 22063]WDF53723.1 MBL fold metallo-hydrolase [Mucilaginibacter sp. KACC 22063]